MLLLKRRQAMTLLEVLIASVLTMLLLSTLTYLYREVQVINTQIEKVQKEQFQRAYVQKRLSTVIPKIIAPISQNNDFFFYTSSSWDGLTKDGAPSLVLTFDHGVNLDKDHASNVIGRIFLDPQGNLCLATWPSPKRWEPGRQPSMKKEILLSNVHSLSFEFYVPPERARDLLVKGEEIKAIPANSWHKEWRQEYRALPPMMRLHVTQINQGKSIPISFAFSLPQSRWMIFYEE